MTESKTDSGGHPWPWLVLCGLLVVLGPVLAIGSTVVKFGDESKKDRLRSVGVPVIATVIDSDSSTNKTLDKTTISYQVDGETFTSTIKGLPAGPTMLILIDRDDPTSFLADNGSTDDSRHPLNHWANIPWGVVLAGLGVARLVTHHRARRKAAPFPAPPRKTTTLNKRGKR
ncbi:hypothetical protein SAMN05444365_103167 [Micromonospora pattaloongensis]|uniref:Uncharacterized protein n=1 Tax=Micromonospora pattaloongensis TaxID=405436 RepID=A0A1H3LZI1_9ACTN|nr:hypothetical protein SAMN05444365_103167 [Micromonospora pattaloongensis]